MDVLLVSHARMRVACALGEQGERLARTAEDLRRTRPERVPPHNLEAEESVLGSMMLSGEAIAAVVEVVKTADFYRPAHQRIFEAVYGVYGRGEPVDAITVIEELKRRKAIDEVGGAIYVFNLVESVPTPASAAYYARIVADNALLRRLIEAASRDVSAARAGRCHSCRRTCDAASACRSWRR